LHTVNTCALKSWRLACLTALLVAWYGLPGWAATVTSHTFGRYEIIVQQGLPVAVGEILGLVRRQTGLPEYPLVLGTRTGVLELSILGPGNRPIRLASTPFTTPSGSGAAPRPFIVERSLGQDETYTLWVRQVHASRQVRLAVDLRHLERMLEGPRSP
jgi:hypothetical protein